MSDRPTGMEQSQVRLFPRKGSEILSLLEVVTPGKRSMLEPIRSALFRLRIQIVRVESVVRDTELLERFQLVEFDGSPIEKKRAALVRAAVRKAVH